MTKPLADRIALVTGASRGIGYATALALAKRGAHIIATARTTGGLEELDDAIRAEGSSATLVPLDIKDTAGLARLGRSDWRALRAARHHGRQRRTPAARRRRSTHTEQKDLGRRLRDQRHRQPASRSGSWSRCCGSRMRAVWCLSVRA